MTQEFVTTACAFDMHELCDDLACMCDCHFPADVEMVGEAA